MADYILTQGVVGVSEIIIKTGLVNVDCADVRAVIKDAGTALMGVSTGAGRTRATDAAVAAISSPLLDFGVRLLQRDESERTGIVNGVRQGGFGGGKEREREREWGVQESELLQ